jgi:serine/threonine protein kinase/Tfp pilus assembly protein PilF
MRSDRWQEVNEIFHSALALSPDKRVAFLTAACQGHESLRIEVESLLTSHEQAAHFIESPPYERAAQIKVAEKKGLRPGQILSSYTIISTLGAGGMGEVYLAQDTRLNRRVALKVFLADLGRDDERLRRFELEAQAASALNHPNILTIYEIGTEGVTHFIATEFIDGQTLRARLQAARVEIAEALNIATQIAAALDAAHHSGIVHRDIKPENVMLREDGLVKVLDFGLAKLTSRKDDRSGESQAPTRVSVNTSPGVVMGTVAYMSPEQARGLPLDARTDIFSLGVVLYEMLAGRLPYPGETTSDVIAAILKTSPLPASQFNAEISAELERMIHKALEKDREERYQTAKDLLVDLRRVKRQSELQSERIPAGTSSAPKAAGHSKTRLRIAVAVLSALLLALIGLGSWFFALRPLNAPIESIAVLPFVNESGIGDVEYLSDGMTESLITSLSQLPNLNVKARGSVFRYKHKDIDPRKVSAELSVQALLLGRVVQHGNDLTLYIELVDAKSENTLWKADYNRRVVNLVALQSEIARDVAAKLRVRLSGDEKQRLAKNYTESVEAYQVYLKGRYHLAKLTQKETQESISYFQQAIDLDPSYALAYVGLATAYRSFTLSFDMPANESLPKAKAAAQKAVEIDEGLAEAHAVMGFTIFWYDWNWDEAENQFKRALELNPNSADTHLGYAHMLSSLGRHAEALAEAKRARELDPLNVLINANEGLYLNHAGRRDEALVRLQKTFELDSNFWLAHLFASNVYSDKGMYVQAVAEARKARELNPISSLPLAYMGYALAKSGKQADSQEVLAELLKLSAEHYVPPSHVAFLYSGFGDHAETLAWLERGYQQRDPKMTFLKVQSNWNTLREDPRFQDLMRRIGFTQ